MSRLAIFDCDGTLVDSQANICRAMVDSGATIHAALTRTLEAHGLAVPPARQARRVIGLSLAQAFALLVPGAAAGEIEALAATYRRTFQALRAAGQVEEPLFEGVAALIEAMAADGWRLAVATGKSDRGLAHCLAANGIGARFVSLQTADRHPSKPHPAMALAAMAEAGAEPAATVMIGDTGWDMGCARAAGLSPGASVSESAGGGDRRDRSRLGLSRRGRIAPRRRALRRRGTGRRARAGAVVGRGRSMSEEPPRTGVPSAEEEALWRRRFGMFALLRLSGLALILGGIAVGLSDLVRPGGWPLLGGALAVAGLVVGTVLPRFARRRWEKL